MTFWYKREECALRVAVFFASATLAGAFGGAIAYGVGHMNMTAGLEGWRWLFILEGLPSVLSAGLVFFIMPDYPSTARWLTPAEIDVAARRLSGPNPETRAEAARIRWPEIRETLTTPRLYVHYLVSLSIPSSPSLLTVAYTRQIFFLAGPPFSSLSLFAPSITAGLGFRDLEAQLMTVPPYASACEYPSNFCRLLLLRC